MKLGSHALVIWLLLGPAALLAQGPGPSPLPAGQADGVERKIETISVALAATQRQIEQSEQQMQQLQQQLLELRQQIADGASAAAAPLSGQSSVQSSAPSNAQPIESSSAPAEAPPADALPFTAPAAAPATLEERLQTLEAAVKLHDQTKVESASKYPIRLTGLILFNGHINKGLPDNTDLPDFALPATSTSGNGDLGASLRQTILGVEGDGPHIAGAHTSGNISFDFFSGISYTSYGTSAGVVRMRTASIDFDWARDSLQVGLVTPLIAPLAPTSYATVAEPSLAGAGNLWTWAPQLRYTHRFPLQDGNRLQFEFGLWDSPAAGYSPNQSLRTASPAELSKQPAYETRLSYGSDRDHGLQFGLGGYYSRQSYPGYHGYAGTENLDSWAGTADWRIPLGRVFEVSGEGYRGRSIGGLGGGVYKDVVTGTSPITGASVLQPLDAIGGWTQLKTRFSSTLESNFSIGQDSGFARDFHAVVLPPTASATQLRARNQMVVANLIFRPKTYIILSPEYRRIWTWPISGSGSTLDIFTLSAGYQF